MSETRFTPGELVGVVRGPVRAVVADASDSPFVAALVAALSARPALDTVIDLLIERSDDELPELVAAERADGSVRLVARGSLAATLSDPGRPDVVVSAPGVRTWLERLEPAAARVVIGPPPGGTGVADPFTVSGDAVLPVASLEFEPAVSSGVGPVAAAPVPLREDPPAGPDPWASSAPPLPSTSPPSLPSTPPPYPAAGTPVTVEPTTSAASDDGAPDPSLVAEPPLPPVTAAVPQEQEPAHPSSDADTIVGWTGDDVAAVADPTGSTTSGPAPDAEAEAGYDFLFGATRARTVEEAAVRSEDEAAPDGVPAAADPVVGPPAAGVITAIPGSVPTGGPVPDLTGDHDGHTISLSQLRSASAAPGAAVDPPGSGTVLSVGCPSGHRNPPHAGVCRVCAAAIADQEPVPTPRPVLGRVRLPGGRTVPLDRPLVLGRSPRVTDTSGAEAPLPVPVDSPKKEVSGTHLELRAEGWQIIAVDRRSTNGTTVHVPGRPPQLLRPDEPVAVPLGTVIELADEVELVVEAQP